MIKVSKEDLGSGMRHIVKLVTESDKYGMIVIDDVEPTATNNYLIDHARYINLRAMTASTEVKSLLLEIETPIEGKDYLEALEYQMDLRNKRISYLKAILKVYFYNKDKSYTSVEDIYHFTLTPGNLEPIIVNLTSNERVPVDNLVVARHMKDFYEVN